MVEVRVSRKVLNTQAQRRTLSTRVTGGRGPSGDPDEDRTLVTAEALGRFNVFEGPSGNREQLTFCQFGDFASPRALLDGSIAVLGPDLVYPNGILVRRDALATTGAARLWILIVFGQSNSVGSTVGESGSDATTPYTTQAPFPGTLLCFNGGIVPLQVVASSASTNVAIAAGQYATVVDAREGLNPVNPSETCAMAFGEVFARNVRDGDKVIIINGGLAGCQFSDLVNGALDSKPQAWLNLETLVTAAKAYAVANNLVAVIPSVLFNQGESDAEIPSYLNWDIKMGILRARVDALKSITVQSDDILLILPQVNYPRFKLTQDPDSNAGDATPDFSHMGKVAACTLGVEYYARVTDPDGACCFPQYSQTSKFESRPHYMGLGHCEQGEVAANLLLDWLGGVSTEHPHMVSASRVFGSRVTEIVLSEPATIETSLIVDPGDHGVQSEDSTGVLEIEDITFSADRTTMYVTHVEEPNGVSEWIRIGCNNGILFVESVGPYPGGSNPEYGVGPEAGQRSQVCAVEWRWSSHRTGRPFHRYFAQQEIETRVTSDETLLADIFDSMGIAPSFVVDFSDPVCWPGSGQVVTDRSDDAWAYQLGSTTGSDSADPTISGTNPVSASFDGGDYLIPSGSPDFADNWHKAAGGFVVGAIYRIPAGSIPATQYLFANCRDTTGGGAGFALRVVTGSDGRTNLTVRGASNTLVMNSGNSDDVIARDAWQLVMYGVDASGNVGWCMTTGAMAAAGNVAQDFTPNYASPSSGAPEGLPAIGRNGTAVSEGSASKLMNGAKVAAVWSCGYQSEARMLPLFHTLSDIMEEWA